MYIKHMYIPSSKLTVGPSSKCLMETSLPTPMTARVYVNLSDGKTCNLYRSLSLYIYIYDVTNYVDI